MLTLPRTREPPETAGEFLDLLATGGGSVQVVDPPERVRAAWRRFLHAAKQDGHVPPGSHLLHRGGDSGDLTIELRRGAHPGRQYRRANEPTLPLPTELCDPHPVVDALRNEPGRLPRSSANRSRCLMILQALAQAADAGGDAVRTGSGDCLLIFVAQDQPYGIRVHEQVSARWPTGRLVLEIDGAGEGRSRWADYVRRPVQENLTEVLATIRCRAAAAVAKQQPEERKVLHQQDRDRQPMVADHRDTILPEQLATRQLARETRSH